MRTQATGPTTPQPPRPPSPPVLASRDESTHTCVFAEQIQISRSQPCKTLREKVSRGESRCRFTTGTGAGHLAPLLQYVPQLGHSLEDDVAAAFDVAGHG